MTSTDQFATTADPSLEIATPRQRRRWSRGRRTAASAGLLVVVLASLVVATLAPSAAPPDRPNERVAIEQAESGRRSDGAGAGSSGDQAQSTSTTAGDGHGVSGGSDPTASAGTHEPSSGSQPAATAGPRLAVVSDLYPEPGDNGALFVIRNVGGAPLHWSIPRDDSPVPVVNVEAGTIAPGDAQLVGFELPSPEPYDDFLYPFTVLSNGGNADVRVHLIALDPVFEIVDGTWNIRNGNTFLVSYTDMDLGLKLKNVGTEPLYVEPQQVDGLAVIGGPWTLQPGEQVHLHLVLCNAAYSGGIPDFHDRDFHIHTDGWQGTIDFAVRFTLAFGQAALPC